MEFWNPILRDSEKYDSTFGTKITACLKKLGDDVVDQAPLNLKDKIYTARLLDYVYIQGVPIKT